MRDDRTLWYIVTPVFKPAPGGGAIYTDTLGRALAADGADVVVVTEAFTGEARTERHEFDRGTMTVDRLFPMRAGRPVIDLRSYLAYARQNLDFTRLPARLRRAIRESAVTRAVVLVHSSFFYKPGVLPMMLNRLKQALPGRTSLIVDVRDPLFTDAHTRLFARFDSAIGCSRTIADKLRSALPPETGVAHIPIPFEMTEYPSEADVAAAQTAAGLEGQRYLLNPNGILERKRYPEMLEIVRALRRLPGMEDVVLVTLGRAHDWTAREDDAVAEGLLRYVGVVPNRTMLALARGAMATMILSRIEGLPRSGLETIALGTPLLAPDIPEFRESIPGHVAVSSNPGELAQQIVRLSEAKDRAAYPLERHAVKNLVPLYRALAETTGVEMSE